MNDHIYINVIRFQKVVDIEPMENYDNRKTANDKN